MDNSDLMTGSSSSFTATQTGPAQRAPMTSTSYGSDLPPRGGSRASPVVIGAPIQSASANSRIKDGSEGEPALSAGPQESGAEFGGLLGGMASLFAEVGQSGQTESGADQAEASASELESVGESSGAFGDLTVIPGFRRRTAAAESESEGEAADVPEVGQALGGGESNTEFFPFLAAALPKLLSIGAPLINTIMGKVGPAVQRAVSNVGAAVARPGAIRRRGASSQSAVLEQILRLLKSRASTESAGEESLSESDREFAAEVAAAMEVIIGNDDRIRISNTTDVPWRSIAALRITFPTGAVYRGTGFFIGPRVLATAGHCVFLRNQGGWARSVEVIPAMNGGTRPYGTARSSTFRSVAGWTVQGRPEADIGCIVLPQGGLTGNPGFFGTAALSASQLRAQAAVMAGYPGDKPFAELWGMARVIKTVTDRTLVYDIDSMGGQSGGPVYIKRNGRRYVVGIHNYGAQSGNSATRVTPAVYDVLNRWSTL